MVEKLLLVIYDLDIDYAKGLMNQLKRRERFPFEVQLVTTLEHLHEVKQEITVLLMDEKLEGTKIHNQVKYVMYLSEFSQDEKHIKRYQSVDKIVMQIEGQTHRQRYGKDKKEEISCLDSSRVIAFYSPIVECGQEQLATVLAKKLAENQKTVYYFDFELIPSFPTNKSPDFFYDLRQKGLFQQDTWSTYFERKGNWNCLYTSLYHNELWNVDREDIEYLISGLRERTETAYYIFDIGFLNAAIIELLKRCDDWFVPIRPGTVEGLRVENLKKLIQFREGEELEEKLIEVDVQNGLEEVWRRLVL